MHFTTTRSRIASGLAYAGFILAAGSSCLSSRAAAAILDPSKPLTSSRVDVRQYGVVRTHGFAAADSHSRILDQLIRQVVVEPGSKATTTKKTLYFPGGLFSTYTFRDPIRLDEQGLRLEGDNEDTTTLSGLVAYPTLIAGLRRNAEGHTLSAENFQDFKGIVLRAWPSVPTARHMG